MTYLQKKGRYFHWTTECQHNFEKLKHLLTIAPLLKVVDPGKSFMVCANARKEGVGGV